MEQPCPTIQRHQFDNKYKVIIRFKSTPGYVGMLDWVNKNSIGSVDVWFTVEEDNCFIDLAFENPSDATFFKIKFSL